MFGPMSFDEQITQLRMELDPRSPKLRLSVMAYLLEHGIKPEDDTEKFIAILETIMKYVGADLDELITELAAAQPQQPAENYGFVQQPTDDNPFGDISPYL